MLTPTPDSHSRHRQYIPFVLSPSQDVHHHLPPLHHSHPHSHHAHSHSLPKRLDTQAVNLMALPSYDRLPPQNQAQRKSSFPRLPMFLILFQHTEVNGLINQYAISKPWWRTRNDEGGTRAIMPLKDDRGIISMKRLMKLRH